MRVRVKVSVRVRLRVRVRVRVRPRAVGECGRAHLHAARLLEGLEQVVVASSSVSSTRK